MCNLWWKLYTITQHYTVIVETVISQRNFASFWALHQLTFNDLTFSDKLPLLCDIADRYYYLEGRFNCSHFLSLSFDESEILSRSFLPTNFLVHLLAVNNLVPMNNNSFLFVIKWCNIRYTNVNTVIFWKVTVYEHRIPRIFTVINEYC